MEKGVANSEVELTVDETVLEAFVVAVEEREMDENEVVITDVVVLADVIDDVSMATTSGGALGLSPRASPSWAEGAGSVVEVQVVPVFSVDVVTVSTGAVSADSELFASFFFFSSSSFFRFSSATLT